MKGVTKSDPFTGMFYKVSIHTPNEGSDHDRFMSPYTGGGVSIHTPNEGSDPVATAAYIEMSKVSIHTPNEGSDQYR